MQGSRFGVGVAAGVLFALVIVALSGVVAPTPSTPGSGSSPYNSRTLITTTANSAGAYEVSTTGTAPASSLTNNLTSSASTVNTENSGQSLGPVTFTSNLAAMGHLSLLSRVVVLAPVVAAVLLGALIYRLSRRSEDESDQPQRLVD